jgi:hypothetical protein
VSRLGFSESQEYRDIGRIPVMIVERVGGGACYRMRGTPPLICGDVMEESHRHDVCELCKFFGGGGLFDCVALR